MRIERSLPHRAPNKALRASWMLGTPKYIVLVNLVSGWRYMASQTHDPAGCLLETFGPRAQVIKVVGTIREIERLVVRRINRGSTSMFPMALVAEVMPLAAQAIIASKVAQELEL